MKIVLIEDTNSLRENIKEILILYNYEVLDFDSAFNNLNKIIEFKPDLILCDIKLPNLDGFQFLKEVRNNEAIHNIPFIIITAKSERIDMRKGMELGADDYITKPFTHTELINSINTRLDRFNTDINIDNNSIKNFFDSLSKTELRILKLIAANESSQSIAEKLFISKKTVDNHRYSISKKLNLKGKLSLLKFALTNLKTINKLINKD